MAPCVNELRSFDVCVSRTDRDRVVCLCMRECVLTAHCHRVGVRVGKEMFHVMSKAAHTKLN
jgi:hypothetical protein